MKNEKNKEDHGAPLLRVDELASPPTTEALPTCQLCGEPMPPGEEMFNYHGYSGPCPVREQK
jgi:hypothetical protein